VSDLSSARLIIDICRGYSESLYDSTTPIPIFIKHFDLEDEYYIDKRREEKLEEAAKKGVPTENEKFQEIKKLKIWTKGDQDEWNEAKMMVENLGKTRQKLFIQSQIKETDDQIKEWDEKWKAKKIHKSNLLGLTAETYAERAASNLSIVRGLFKDKTLTQPFIDCYEDLDMEEFNKLGKIFFKGFSHIDSTSLKKAALSTQFQNLYSINENPYYFLLRPTYKLTNYQTSLLSYGRFFKVVLSELGDMVTEDLKDQPDKLERLFISHRNKEAIKAQKGKNVEFFGDETQAASFREMKESEMLQKGFNSIEAANAGLLG
jgi:hypothetical protein